MKEWNMCTSSKKIFFNYDFRDQSHHLFMCYNINDGVCCDYCDAYVKTLNHTFACAFTTLRRTHHEHINK